MGTPRFKQSKDVNRDIFPGFSEIMAQQRMDELEWFIGTGGTKLSRGPLSLKERTDMISFLKKRVEDYYRASSRKWKSAEDVRDFMIAFTRHWLSGYCKDHHKNYFEYLPESFIMGEYNPDDRKYPYL